MTLVMIESDHSESLGVASTGAVKDVAKDGAGGSDEAGEIESPTLGTLSFMEANVFSVFWCRRETWQKTIVIEKRQC